MAFALGFPRDVTDRIYDMRDWRWEMVRDGGETPSAQCFNESRDFANGTADYAATPRPAVIAYGMAKYSVCVWCDESDSDYGKVVGDDSGSAWIWVYKAGSTLRAPNAAKTIWLQGRGKDGIPPKFRRLRRRNDKRIKETWFQCEPCASGH